MSEDGRLQKAVLTELVWEPSVTAAHIGVTANEGVVTLTGHVGSLAEKHAAEVAARRVKGVKALVEEIEIRLPLHVKWGDDEIAAAAVNRLSWDISVPKDAVKGKVEKGFVTLTGELDWQFQKEAVALDVRSLSGVTGVANKTTIRLGPDTADISDDIKHALHRSWFDADNIQVSADGGKVRLTGTVDSWSERQMAGSTAWAAPGTTAVENHIRIN